MTKVERQRMKAKEQRMQAQQMMGAECCECGNCDRLEYHHKDPNTKEFNVAQYFGRIRWERIEGELRKCIVLCRPCHETTFGETFKQRRTQ